MKPAMLQARCLSVRVKHVLAEPCAACGGPSSEPALLHWRACAASWGNSATPARPVAGNGQLSSPVALALAPSGSKIYVLDSGNSRVQVGAPGRTPSTLASLKEPASPRGRLRPALPECPHPLALAHYLSAWELVCKCSCALIFVVWLRCCMQLLPPGRRCSAWRVLTWVSGAPRAGATGSSPPPLASARPPEALCEWHCRGAECGR